MQTVKQIIHDIANHLPEQATFDDAMYALYVRQKLEKGLRDLDEGRTYTQEEVEQRLLGKHTS
jgi:predicted transcriptional regulator